MTLFGKMLFAGVIELRRGHGGSAQCPCSLSHVQLFAIPWTVAHQAPLSMGFSRQEYCSGLPCPSPGDLPDPGMEPVSFASPALQADSLLLYHRGLVLGQSAPYSNDWDPYKRAIWTKTQGRRPYKDGGGDGSDTAASSGMAGDHQKPGWGTGVSQSLQKEETLLLC